MGLFVDAGLTELIGATGSIIAVFLSIIIYFLTRKKKTLSYEVLSEYSVVSIDDEIKGKLQISYGGNPVENVHLLLVKFINSGNVPITKGDFERPITLRFKEKSSVLSAELARAGPDNLTVSVEVTDQVLTFEPVLMNGGDFFTAKVLIGQYSGEFDVDARVVGVKTIRVVRRQPQTEWVHREWRPTLAGALVTLVVMALILLLFILLNGTRDASREPPLTPALSPRAEPEPTPQEISRSNPARINVPAAGRAAPYPSEIEVSGLSGAVGKVTVDLIDVSHTYVKDLDVMLVGPDGKRVVLMAGVGGKEDLNSALLVFDDDAQPMPSGEQDAPSPTPRRNKNAPENSNVSGPRPLPPAPGPLVPGTYCPTTYRTVREFMQLAKGVTISDKLSAFTGIAPNGRWKLYVFDTNGSDDGGIGGGWKLTLTINPGPPAPSPPPPQPEQ